jgi:Ca2+-binding RTX toxin-like protein
MANLDLLTLTPSIQYISDAATEDLFGANFLFSRDGTLRGPEVSLAYQEYAREVGLTTIRYPGGTMSEVSFDLSDPNALGAYNTGKKGTIPLSSFLEYAASIGATGTIVVPTYRFLSSATDLNGQHIIDESKKSVVKEFVTFALSEAERLGTSIAAFELGNEWWVDNSSVFGFRMSPIEYGRVANFLAEAIEEAINEYNFNQVSGGKVNPNTVIQVGPGGNAEWYSRAELGIPNEGTGLDISATEVIFRQITSPIARGAIDGTLMHRYLHGTDSAIGDWVYRPFTTWDFLAGSTSGFQSDVSRYVTEWNVSARNTNEIGLKQFDTMVLLIEEMLRSGVDLANVWAVQQNNSTKMIYNTGLRDDPFGGLTFGGLAIDMMAAQLPGQSVVLQPHSLQGLDSIVFGSQDRFVYFLTNKGASSRTDTLSLARLPATSHHVTIYSIEEGPDGKPSVTIRTLDLSSGMSAQTLQFAPFATFMIVVARASAGSVIEGYGKADVITGSSFNDTISGGENGDNLSGGSGDDGLDGETGNDSLHGDGGNDTLVGGLGDDLLYGGAGDDLIFGGFNSDTILGGSGLDIVSLADIETDISVDLALAQDALWAVGNSFISQVEGVVSGNGNDSIRGDSTGNLISGGGGFDIILGLEGGDTLLGDGGGDVIDGGDGDDRIEGGAGLDSLLGGSGMDFILGGDGDDQIFGGSEFDVLDGGNGSDTLSGGPGIDVLLGGEGDDFLEAGGDSDRLFGGEGQDVIFGGDGFDLLDGGNGNDVLYGGSEADYLRGGTGEDSIFGDTGNDSISGGYGDDLMFGGSGDDTIWGSDGADTLQGGAGNDELFGGNGDDVLFGGDGLSKISGGFGCDQFIFSFGSSRTAIADFQSGMDSIVFSGGGFAAVDSVEEFLAIYAHDVDSSIVFDFGASTLILSWDGDGLSELTGSIVLLPSTLGSNDFVHLV